MLTGLLAVLVIVVDAVVLQSVRDALVIGAECLKNVVDVRDLLKVDVLSAKHFFKKSAQKLFL